MNTQSSAQGNVRVHQKMKTVKNYQDQFSSTKLSKDQIKLMKQLEKMQQTNAATASGAAAAAGAGGQEADAPPQQLHIPTKKLFAKNQMTSETNQNRKNVIENYFKIGGQTMDQPMSH